jgi:perosamine synthetase
MIPISSVHTDQEEEKLVLQVLRSGRLAQGPMVERFEELFSSLVGSRFAVAVSSGTAALVLAIESLELREGDEVITTPFTFVAVLNALLRAGATIRFADIGEDFNLDPSSVEAVTSERTRAIVPVHLYGQPADLDGIMKVASPNEYSVIEDAAQAHGAKFEGRSVGAFGYCGCFSFYATKNVTMGEGGIVTTDDEGLADHIRLVRGQGMRKRYEYEALGHNYRLTELQAAVGIPQLSRLEKNNEVRRSNAHSLTKALDGIHGLSLPREIPGRHHVYHQYTVRLMEGAQLDRDGLAGKLLKNGVETGIYYPRLVHDYDCFRGHPQIKPDPTPFAESATREVLSLPVHPQLTPGDIEEIATSVRDAMDA